MNLKIWETTLCTISGYGSLSFRHWDTPGILGYGSHPPPPPHHINSTSCEWVLFQPSPEHEKKKKDLEPHLALLVLQPALVCLCPGLVCCYFCYKCRFVSVTIAAYQTTAKYSAWEQQAFVISGHWKKLIEHRWPVPLNKGLGLLNLAHKNTGCPAKFEYWMHSG